MPRRGEGEMNDPNDNPELPELEGRPTLPGEVQMPTSPPLSPETVIFTSPPVPPAPPAAPPGPPVAPPAPPAAPPGPPVAPPAPPSFGPTADRAAVQQPVPEWVQASTQPITPTLSAPSTPTKSSRLGWIAAAIGALVLLGGGAFFALGAVGQDGGSETPEAAVAEMFAALSNEDFVTVATLIEPGERRSLVEPTFEIIEELQRLNVLADDLDTGSVDGIDLEYNDVEFRTNRVADDLYQVFIEGGETVSSFDVAELPLGDLIRDRLSPEELSETGIERGLIESSDVPIAVVERDGRWYWSLWYTVGEAARQADGRAFPSGRTTLLPSGTDNPEDVMRVMFERAFEFDLSGLVALMDPEETAALYDYSPLFLTDAQSEAVDLRSQLRNEGYQWQLDSIESDAEVDGDDARLSIRSMAASLSGPNVDVAVSLIADGSTGSFGLSGTADGESVDVSVELDENGCATVSIDIPGQELEPTTTCPGDELTTEQDEIFDALNLGETGVRTLAAHRVDGQWYLAPTDTVMTIVLDYLRGIDPMDFERAIETLGTTGGSLLFDDLMTESGFDDSFTDAFDEAFDEAMDDEGGFEDNLFAPGPVEQVGLSLPLDLDADGYGFATGALAPGVVDHYTVTLGEGQAAAIILRSPDFDSFLTVVDPEGFTIGTNDDFDLLDSGLDLFGPGEFTIQAGSLNNDGAGIYTVEVFIGQTVSSLAASSNEPPPLETATTTRVPWQRSVVSLQGVLQSNLADIYELDLAAGDQITVNLVSPDDSIDTFLRVFGDEGLLVENDDFDGLNSGVQFVVPADGLYAIEVSDFAGAIGAYNLTISPGFVLGG